MREELSIGMYVRTTDIGIKSICKMISNGSFYTENGYEILSNVLKASFNIIDLIEVGDYVNGKKVIQIYKPKGTYCLWILLENEVCIADCESFNIKEILTHESYENNIYRVKE